MTTATKEITNSQNVIDSRDVIERIAKLQGAEDEQAELKLLQALEEEANGAENWQYGVMLIRDSYFTEYAKELCRDIGDLPKELPWYIESNIDWDGVAKDLQNDYFSVDFDGIVYWVR